MDNDVRKSQMAWMESRGWLCESSDEWRRYGTATVGFDDAMIVQRASDAAEARYAASKAYAYAWAECFKTHDREYAHVTASQAADDAEARWKEMYGLKD